MLATNVSTCDGAFAARKLSFARVRTGLHATVLFSFDRFRKTTSAYLYRKMRTRIVAAISSRNFRTVVSHLLRAKSNRATQVDSLKFFYIVQIRARIPEKIENCFIFVRIFRVLFSLCSKPWVLIFFIAHSTRRVADYNRAVCSRTSVLIIVCRQRQ